MSLKKNIRALIAYEGTCYLGWQRTNSGLSIEQALEDALLILLKSPTQIQAASRTDAGVHARGQVINFFVDPETNLNKLLKGLNALLPDDIAVRDIEIADPCFHPTLDARAKEYHYDITYSSSQSPFLRNFSWHYAQKLNLPFMQEAAQYFIGIYDFSSFCNGIKKQNKDPICHIHHCSIEEITPGQMKIRVIGDRFLYKMARNLVGTLVGIGCCKLSVEDIPYILRSKDRVLAGMTAPPNGLCLNKVYYDDF